MTVKPWKRIEPTKVTKVGWRTIISKSFRMPSGHDIVFDTFHPAGQQSASVIALTSDLQVVSTRHFLPGPEKIMDNLPGGFVDPGELPQQAGRRELLEETGYQTGGMEYIGAVHIDAYMNVLCHVFLATNCTYVSGENRELEEDIEVRLISIDMLIQNAKQGKTTHGAVIFLAYDRLRELQRKDR